MNSRPEALDAVPSGREITAAERALPGIAVAESPGLVIRRLRSQTGFGLLLRLIARGLRAAWILNGQVHLPLGVVELALLSDQVGLSLLGFRQPGVALFEHFVEFRDFLGLILKVNGDYAVGLLCLCGNDLAAFPSSLAATEK
jgi:hypothetical protein